jgi:hypothetical protein
MKKIGFDGSDAVRARPTGPRKSAELAPDHGPSRPAAPGRARETWPAPAPAGCPGIIPICDDSLSPAAELDLMRPAQTTVVILTVHTLSVSCPAKAGHPVTTGRSMKGGCASKETGWLLDRPVKTSSRAMTISRIERWKHNAISRKT